MREARREGPQRPGKAVCVPPLVSRNRSPWTLFAGFPLTATGPVQRERAPGPQSPLLPAAVPVRGLHSEALCLPCPLPRRGKWGVGELRRPPRSVPQASSRPGRGAARRAAVPACGRVSVRVSGLLPASARERGCGLQPGGRCAPEPRGERWLENTEWATAGRGPRALEKDRETKTPFGSLKQSSSLGPHP